MGAITANNLTEFKSAQPMFDRIKKRLSSFDSASLIDDGDFYKEIVWVISQVGIGAFKEQASPLYIKNGKAKLPANFSVFHAAYVVESSNKHFVPSINEQRPYVYYVDTEIHKECAAGNCCTQCTGPDSKTKIVVRTFINGEDKTCTFTNPCLLRLTANVEDQCTEDSPSIFCSGDDEISIRDGYLFTNLGDESIIYLQYYGIPVDQNGLPMIPKSERIEKAIEYYIYSQLFEEFYWNGTVPNIANMLQDVRVQSDKFLEMAKYEANLPSFSTMVEAIRRVRQRRKFYYSAFDRTISN